jgi:hypothetical protein
MAEPALGLIGVLVFMIVSFREESMVGCLAMIVVWSLFVDTWASATVSSSVYDEFFLFRFLDLRCSLQYLRKSFADGHGRCARIGLSDVGDRAESRPST